MAKSKKQQRPHTKLDPVPKDARIVKRTITRPPLVSQYASKDRPKMVYISTKTHFMSAIKRIEGLLKQTERREMHSATTKARAAADKQPRNGSRKEQASDEIDRVVDILSSNDNHEAVIAKSTGKAIQKAMQVGLWFQERPQYTVVLHTSTTSAIDEVQIDLPSTSNAMDVDSTKKLGPLDIDLNGEDDDQRDFTRTRNLSVLEVHIRLR